MSPTSAMNPEADSIVHELQKHITTNNAMELSRSLASCNIIADLYDEESFQCIERLQHILSRDLRRLQDPVSLVINTLISISAMAETTFIGKDMELNVTQFLIGALRHFLDWSETSNTSHEGHQQFPQMDPQTTRASSIKISSLDLLDENENAIELGSLHLDQPHLVDLSYPCSNTHFSSSSTDMKARPKSSMEVNSNGEDTVTTRVESRVYPIHSSHKQMISKEIAFRRSTSQIYALMDVFDMYDLLNETVQNHHVGQESRQHQTVEEMEDETYGSRLALQLVCVGQTTEAILLISRVLDMRSKELDSKVIPYLIDLEDLRMVNEFVKDYNDVCQMVLGAIENRLRVQIEDMEQVSGPKVQVRLAAIAMDLVMQFDLEKDLSKSFPSIKSMINYNTIMTLLDESQFSSLSTGNSWSSMTRDPWRFLPAVEAMIKGDPKLQKMVIVYCLYQGAMDHESYFRVAMYLARKLGLEKEIQVRRIDARQYGNYEQPPEPQQTHDQQQSFANTADPGARNKGAPQLATKTSLFDISDATTLSRESNQGFPRSTPPSPPPSPPSPSLPLSPLLTLPQPTSRRRLVPVLESLSNSSTRPVLTMESTTSRQSTDLLNPVRLSYPPRFGPLYPLYNLPSTTRVVLVDRIDQLIHLDRTLKLSYVVGVSSLLVTDTHPLSLQDTHKQPQFQYQDYQPPYHHTEQTDQQYPIFGSTRWCPTMRHKMTGLLQLACDKDDCVYVVDTTAFLKDHSGQLSRVIGEFFSNQTIQKIVFNWYDEQAVLEYTFPLLKLRENRLNNCLDLGRVWCMFSRRCRHQGDGCNGIATSSTTESTQSQRASAAPAGLVTDSAKYNIEFWSMRCHSVHMTNLGAGGPHLALKKIYGKRLPREFRRANWERRPLTGEQVNRAGQC
ncbi:MAG: hypothetical protein J3Q66DRAFT_430244 [Benniella sp.]|nr:MAG: hypothetical protein J3Q66DRAFT_430244 [Benniella sp.]